MYPCSRGFRHVQPGDTRGQIQDTLGSLHVLSGLEMPWCATGGAGGSGLEEAGLGLSAETA